MEITRNSTSARPVERTFLSQENNYKRFTSSETLSSSGSNTPLIPCGVESAVVGLQLSQPVILNTGAIMCHMHCRSKCEQTEFKLEDYAENYLTFTSLAREP